MFFIYIHVHKYVYMYGSHHTAQATEFQAPSCLSLPSVRIMGMHYHAWSMNLKPLNLSDCLCTQETRHLSLCTHTPITQGQCYRVRFHKLFSNSRVAKGSVSPCLSHSTRGRREGWRAGTLIGVLKIILLLHSKEDVGRKKPVIQ